MATKPEDAIWVTATQIQQPFTEDLLGFKPGFAHLTVENQNIRYFYTGENPATDNGHLIYAGASEVFDKSSDIQNLKILSASGTAKVTYTIKGV